MQSERDTEDLKEVAPRQSGLASKLLERENLLVLLVIPIVVLVLTSSVKGNLGYWTEFWWMLFIAFGFAVVVNTIGISGAALFVPFFAILFPSIALDLAPGQVVMLGLITESFGISSSTLAFLRYGLVDLRIALVALEFGMPVVLAFSVVFFLIPGHVIYFVISVALLLSVYSLNHERRAKAFESERTSKVFLKTTHDHKKPPEIVRKTDRNGKTYEYCRCGYRTRAYGYSLGGVFQGLSGFGMGEMGIVASIKSGVPAKVGVGTNHIVVALTAILASAAHIIGSSSTGSSSPPWNIVIMTVPAVIIGGQIAPYVSARLNTKLMERILSVLFVILAAALITLAL